MCPHDTWMWAGICKQRHPKEQILDFGFPWRRASCQLTGKVFSGLTVKRADQPCPLLLPSLLWNARKGKSNRFVRQSKNIFTYSWALIFLIKAQPLAENKPLEQQSKQNLNLGICQLMLTTVGRLQQQLRGRRWGECLLGTSLVFQRW